MDERRSTVTRQPTVHEARSADAAAVARIYVDSWNQGFQGLMPARVLTSELVARWSSDLAAPHPCRWWVAEVDGRAVGFAGIGPSREPGDPRLGELDTIAVAPAWWRRGVGCALMRVALDALDADGYAAAVLWTLARYPRGQRFYEHMGWRPDGATRDNGRQVRYALARPFGVHPLAPASAVDPGEHRDGDAG
jgi:GNAT superfamily N-acetyltransferase